MFETLSTRPQIAGGFFVELASYRSYRTQCSTLVLWPQQNGSFMFDGPSVVAALKQCDVTHVVWLPDSELGTWEGAITGLNGFPLIRVCREGEAIAVAAGLMLGGQRPVVVIQCTGLFEAGDALRNIVHDLKLPLFLIVGVRS